MDCAPEILIQRIRLRGRDEESLISVNFLSSLSKFVKQEIKEIKSKNNSVSVLEIDTEKINIVKNPLDQSSVLEKISQIIQ